MYYVANVSDTSCYTGDDIQATQAEIFQSGLLLCTRTKANLHLKPGAKPVFRAKRRAPYSSQKSVDEELDRSQASRPIKLVNYSAWAASIGVAKKPDDSVRLCTDYSTGLNTCLQMRQYSLPTPADLFPKLKKKWTIFSKIDLSDAYFQAEVQEFIRELQTIDIHLGIHQRNISSLGIKCAPATFQRMIDTMPSDLPFAFVHLDDTVIVSKTQADHMHNLDGATNMHRRFGFTLRITKCSFFLSNIQPLGLIIGEIGRRPDPSKVASHYDHKMEVQSLLCLVNYCHIIAPNMYNISGPLNKLLKCDSKLCWSKECHSSVDELKKVLASCLLPTHYDLPSTLILSTRRLGTQHWNNAAP